LGGLVVGIGGYFQPRALGVGYDVIEELLKGDVLVQSALALLTVKSLIWVVSLASGTSGGVLAPLLMMGCGLGVLESLFLPESCRTLYPLISMAAVMGGMMRSPFTAVIFTLELTHNVEAMVPVLTATIVSYAVTVLVMKRSILTEKVARRGYDLFREYGVDPLEIVRVQEVMTKDVVTIPVELPIKDVLSTYFNGNQKFRGYPVVDDQGALQGILTASDLLANRLHSASAIEYVGDLACKQLITIEPDASCREAAEKMASLNIGRLPVVSADKAQRLLGIVTRSDLLKPRLSQYELERKKERIFSFRKPDVQRRTVGVMGE